MSFYPAAASVDIVISLPLSPFYTSITLLQKQTLAQLVSSLIGILALVGSFAAVLTIGEGMAAKVKPLHRTLSGHFPTFPRLDIHNDVKEGEGTAAPSLVVRAPEPAAEEAPGAKSRTSIPPPPIPGSV